MRKLILGLIVIIVMIGTAAGDPWVQGKILKDGVLAEAVVTAYDESNTEVGQYTTTNGYYAIQLIGMSVGQTVFVEADSSGDIGSASSIIGSYFVPELNIYIEGAYGVDIILAPEFPTVALPVAAIIGLAFIFQRRRDEE